MSEAGKPGDKCPLCSEHIFEDDFVTFTFCCEEQQTAQEEAIQ